MPTFTSTLVLTETEFITRFGPIPGDNGSVLWKHDATLKHPHQCVWSVLDIDGQRFAIPGYAVLNVVGHSVTREQWPHDNIEVSLD